MVLITGFVNRQVLDDWERALRVTSFNRFEGAAIRTAFEAMEHLIVARDDVDRRRDEVSLSGDGNWWYSPSHIQQKQVFRAVATFHDTFYTSLSAWAGVVARFNDVFGRNFSTNAAFLAWFREEHPDHQLIYMELDRARLFRALLSHPQQFPAYEWGTYASEVDPLFKIVVHGPFGRGNRRIPEGSVESHSGSSVFGDWQFEAPDEVSVANSVAHLAKAVLAQIICERTTRSAFQREISFEAAMLLLERDNDVSESARSRPRAADLRL